MRDGVPRAAGSVGRTARRTPRRQSPASREPVVRSVWRETTSETSWRRKGACHDCNSGGPGMPENSLKKSLATPSPGSCARRGPPRPARRISPAFRSTGRDPECPAGPASVINVCSLCVSIFSHFSGTSWAALRRRFLVFRHGRSSGCRGGGYYHRVVAETVDSRVGNDGRRHCVRAGMREAGDGWHRRARS